jgi:hypothetical protein
LVSLPITFVETFDKWAREGRTLAARINSIPDRAISDLALATMLGFGIVLSPASQTRIFLLEMFVTNPTIHAAGR